MPTEDILVDSPTPRKKQKPTRKAPKDNGDKAYKPREISVPFSQKQATDELNINQSAAPERVKTHKSVRFENTDLAPTRLREATYTRLQKSGLTEFLWDDEPRGTLSFRIVTRLTGGLFFKIFDNNMDKEAREDGERRFGRSDGNEVERNDVHYSWRTYGLPSAK